MVALQHSGAGRLQSVGHVDQASHAVPMHPSPVSPAQPPVQTVDGAGGDVLKGPVVWRHSREPEVRAPNAIVPGDRETEAVAVGAHLAGGGGGGAWNGLPGTRYVLEGEKAEGCMWYPPPLV